MHIRTALPEDETSLIPLYKALIDEPDGIAIDDLEENYIRHQFQKSLASGLTIVVEHPENESELIGVIHASACGARSRKHVWSSLNLIVHPEYRRKKIARTILTIFLEEIGKNKPDVGKVEVIIKETNTIAIQLFQSLGFLIEGRLEMRVKNEDGSYEADIPLGWHNPNFEFDLP